MKDFRFRPKKKPKKEPVKRVKREKPKSWVHLLSEIGIYKIECVESKSVYIGQSKQITHRLKTHKRAIELREYKYLYPDLYEDFIKYGIEGFMFECICNCEEYELLEQETRFLKQYYNDGYRIYNKVMNTDTGIVNCPTEFKEVVQKVIKKLDTGQIKASDLERALDYGSFY